MAGLVVPYRGSNGKSRLAAVGTARERIALAMLADVVCACIAVGPTTVVTDGGEAASLVAGLGANVVDDPGGGQGAAVEAALASVEERPVLVVNSDLPAVTPRDLLSLLGAMPPDGMAIVEALDGTTNAIALSAPHLFAPLYGPGSAARFRAHAEGLGVELVVVDIPNLVADVDTPEDLAGLTEAALGVR
jgi:2-phospho-L-lactate/phosphoenolpyruvate guanylyltransferase